MNGVTTGTRMTRLTLGLLPKTMARQLQNARKYRRRLEAAVEDVKGSISVYDAHLIDEAANAEVHASVCKWLLRTRLETMTVAEISACSAQVLKSKTIRNKAVEQLDLEREPVSPWVIDAEQDE